MQVIIAALLLTALPVHAGTYNAEYIKSYDADSHTFRVDIWPGHTFEGNFRLFGVDTPELSWRAKCPSERKSAEYARSYTIGLLQAAKSIRVTVESMGKFGRPLAIVEIDGEDLRQSLINAGYARRYMGGKRSTWCAENPPQ